MIHEAWPLDDLEQAMSMSWGWKWPLADDIRQAANQAEKIIFPAHHTANKFSAAVPPDRLMVIHNGVDIPNASVEIDQVTRDVTRGELGIEADEFVVFHPGTVNHRKNQHLTAQSVYDLARGKQIKLSALFVGAGEFVITKAST